MNFNRPAASVFAQIAKHGSAKNFPRQTTFTQLRQPTQNQTDEDTTKPYKLNTTQRRSYASATRRTNSRTATTSHHNLSIPSTLPSLRPLTRTPTPSAIILRHNTSTPLPTAQCTTDVSKVSIHVKPPLHHSLPQKPDPARYDPSDLSATPDEFNAQIKRAVVSKDYRKAEDLFKVIKERRITADFTTLSLMLDVRAETSRGTETETREILELYDEIVTIYKPDDASHSAVIRGLFIRFQKIADVLQKSYEEKSLVTSGSRELESQEFVCSESALLLELEMTKVCDLMWEYFQKLSKKSALDYQRIGAAVSFRADVNRMDELRKSMPDEAMNYRMYSYMINTYGSSNDFAEARKLFEAAMRMRWGQHQYEEICRIFAKICVKHGSFLEAMRLTERPLSNDVLQTIVLGCLETGNSSVVAMLDSAEQMWPESSTGAGRVAHYFTNFAFLALRFSITKNNIELAANILNRLSTRTLMHVDRTQGIEAALREYVDLCLAGSRKQEALQAVRFMVQCKITPDPKAISSLFLKLDLSAAETDEILDGITANLADPKRHTTECAPFVADYRSLVKQLADKMIGTRRFALSAARLGFQEADESWMTFIAKLKNAATELHPVLAPSDHPTALELAARSDDKDEICTVVNAMRSGDLVPPALDTPTYEHVLKVITANGDDLSLGWWKSNASRLASHEPCLNTASSLLINRNHRFERHRARTHVANRSLIEEAIWKGHLDTVCEHLAKAMPTLAFSTVQFVFQTYGEKKDFLGAQAVAAFIDDAAKKATQKERKKFLSRMSSSGLAVSCIFGGEYNMAKDILDYMVTKAGLKPEVDVYAYYISQQKLADPTSSAYQIFQEVLSLGIKPSVFFLNTVLHKFGLGRRMDYAFEVFDQFKKNKLTPDEVTYGSAINAAVRGVNEEVAVQLFSEQLQLALKGSIRPTAVPFNIMMQYYVGTRKNREAVLYYWNLLHRHGHAPSRVAYLSLLQAYTCLLPVDMNRAEALLKEIPEPTGSQYAALIFGYGYRLRDFEAANSVMDRMLQRLTERPNSVIEPQQAWEALVASHVAHKNIQEAKQVRAQMVESMPHLPTLYLDNALIRGCALFDEDEDEHIGTARGLYDAMGPAVGKQDRRTPDTYVAMIAVYLNFGQMDRAQEVLSEMMVRKFPARVTKEAEELVADPVPQKVEHWVMTNLLRLPALQ